MRDGRRRLTVGATLGIALLLVGWHVSPVVLWHARFEAELATQGRADQLTAPRRGHGSAPPDWPELRVANLRVRLPLRDDERGRCSECAVQCKLGLLGGGHLAIFDEPPPEDLGQALDRFAPDATDLSVFRSVSRNWRTIDGLTDRVRATSTLPKSARFDTGESRGIVTSFLVQEMHRFVVYGYAPDGTPTRVLGVTGTSEERFERILGSLRVETLTAAPGTGTCE